MRAQRWLNDLTASCKYVRVEGLLHFLTDDDDWFGQRCVSFSHAGGQTRCKTVGGWVGEVGRDKLNAGVDAR